MENPLPILLTGVIGGAVLLSHLLRRHSNNHHNGGIQEKMGIVAILNTYGEEFNRSRILEQIIPKEFNSQEQLRKITSSLYYTQNVSHLSSLTKSISQPVWDLLDRGGKRWRPILCMLIAELYGFRRQTVFDIAALCQIIHNGTLIIDDIEDSSKVRRNKQCVHLLYGVDISLNAGNFMYFAPMMYLLRSKKYTESQMSQMCIVYVEQMTSLHVGQGWDILWHNVDKLEGKYPTEDDYLQMTAHKTGVLARLSARLTCIALNVPQNQSKVIWKLAESMGVAFQIQDDILNLEGQQYIKTKGYSGEDIHEGKMTLMVLHCIQHSSSKDRLIQILKMKTQDMNFIREAIELLKNSGSIDYARRKMQLIIDEAWKEAERELPQNTFRSSLKDLAYFNIQRKM